MTTRLQSGLIAVLMSAALVGCSPQTHAPGLRARDMDGRAVRGVDPGPLQGVQNIGTMLARNRPITTRHLMILRFSRGGDAHESFHGVLGPIAAVMGDPDDQSEVTAIFRNPVYMLYFSNGFLYLTGHRPHTRTARGSYTGWGTIMIVQNLQDRDRVFLLEGERITILLEGLAPEAEDDRLKMPWHYVEVSGVREGVMEIGQVLPIPGKGDPIRDFVDAAILAAREAGLPTPMGP